MPPRPLADLSAIDLNREVAGPDQIRRHNAQRFEMEQLDRVVHLDLDAGLAVGIKDVRPDEFWVRGHVPGRPLLPGVLMCEAAAQLCSYFYKVAIPNDRFLGFGGMENVKFRGTVVPGDRLVLVARSEELKPRRARFVCQGLVGDRVVFEAVIIGMPL